LIVLITGLKRSGKDTAAKGLVEHRGFVKYAFADPIRSVCKVVFDWTEDHFENKDLKESIDPEWGISPRQAMQWTGTEAFQYNISETFPLFENTTGRKIWARKFLKWRSRSRNRSKNVVIPDWRFPHEREELMRIQHKEKILFMRINNPRIKPSDAHESEIHIPELLTDIDIENDGTIEELHSKIVFYIDKNL
jgi:hypothetical protein